MCRFAETSPRSIRFASMTSSAAVSSLWRPTSARKSCRLSADPEIATGGGGGRGPLRLLLFLAGFGRLSRSRRHGRLADLESGALELARELFAFVVVQLELVRECL